MMCNSSFVIGTVMGTIFGALLALITITLLMVAMEKPKGKNEFLC